MGPLNGIGVAVRTGEGLGPGEAGRATPGDATAATGVLTGARLAAIPAQPEPVHASSEASSRTPALRRGIARYSTDSTQPLAANHHS